MKKDTGGTCMTILFFLFLLALVPTCLLAIGMGT